MLVWACNMYYSSDFLEITFMRMSYVMEYFLYCKSYNYYISGHPSARFCLEHRPVYIPKHSVLESGSCLHHQVKPTQLGSIDRASPNLLFRIVLSVEYLVRYAQDAGGP
jgi:hypothetical protein